ncbi:FAD dependent oxidoreductase [Acididesulfobacillus acetoxydans]|uniref:FAD dependent oxidoreductase n=1 Tax=Acididesulfobacillus acetoxydans TaxID=1561005 RepID=A0A8S0WX01_9FIRM|nr:FAD-dependent oxidoreductase [Acididesulfobacillus acetoxydans]CAA7600631.1 FAD dependent oxidoreductase [Acididesulfobacillus acetoxydans]CEJ09412.1 Invasion protein IbeA [Acididesulfobacillus acetoxydans]
MKFIKEPAKEVPVFAEVDVLVVGGGPAGLAAAVSSAREGVSTMLIERYGCFGGVISQVGVEGFAWYRHKETVEAGGLAFEFEDVARDLGASTPRSESDSEALDAEMFKYVADSVVRGAGIRPLLHCYAAGVIVENDIIQGVITESKSGRLAILARRVIDCTGDGDIAALAGVPFTKREKLAWVTPMFHCRGVDGKKFLQFIKQDLKPTFADWSGEWSVETGGKENKMFSPYLSKPFNDAIRDGILRKTDGIEYGGSYGTVSPEGDVTQLNVVFISGIDSTNVKHLTDAELKGREAVLNAIRVLKKYVPGFEKARLRNFGMTVGTRESRQIEGYYRITGEDVLNQARFEDSIGIFPEFVDGNGVLRLPTTGRYFQIPYRAILPQKVDNLLVAGRCISGDILAQSAFRSMSCCVLTGQGAGVAAAISLKESATTSIVDIKKVQKALEKQGVRLF